MYVTLRDRPGAEKPPVGARARVASTIVLLGVVSMFTDVSSEMVTAVLPIYLTAHVGVSLLGYGFIDGLYQGVSAFVRILGGYAADRGRHPKWVAVVGYGVSALSRILLLPAQTLGAITAVITVDRLGKGLRTAPRDALIADASDPATLGRSFGVHRMLDTVGAAAGPIIAFALLFALPEGFDAVFVVSAAFAVVGVAVLVLFVPNRRTGGRAAATVSDGAGPGGVGPDGVGPDGVGPDGVGPDGAPGAGAPAGRRGRGLLRAIGAPALRRPLTAAALLGLLTVGDGFLYLTLQQRDDLAAAYFPLLAVGTNVAYLALAVPFGRLADRFGRSRMFLAGHVALLGAYLAAGALTGGLAATVGALVLFGAFYAATDGVLPALVSRLVPEVARGTGIAAAQTVVVVARFASSLGFGVLAMNLGTAHALLWLAPALAVALPAAAWLLRPTLPRPTLPRPTLPRPTAGATA